MPPKNNLLLVAFLETDAACRPADQYGSVFNHNDSDNISLYILTVKTGENPCDGCIYIESHDTVYETG